MADRIITCVYFEPTQGFDVFAETEFSDATKIRIDRSEFKGKLSVQDATSRYPTDSDLYIKTRTYNPEAIKQILMVQVNGSIPTDEDGNDLGTINLRLHDGTNEYYWDGGAWSVASSTDWNTLDEINQNIQSYDVVSTRKFGFVINLQTSDNRVTPIFESLFVLWQGNIDWSQDIILQSLTQTFQEEISYPVPFSLPSVVADTTTLDFDNYTLESDLNIQDVGAVYDHSADPNHINDLLDSYNPTTKEITLTSPILAGNIPYLRLNIAPEVAWQTHQDFEEVGKLPQVLLGDTRIIKACPFPPSYNQTIVRQDDGTGVETQAPYRMTYNVICQVRTDRSVGQQRILDSIYKLLHNGPSTEVGPFLRSRATDRRYRIWLYNEFEAVKPEKNMTDLMVFETEFRIEDVALDLREAIDSFAVQNINLNFKVANSEDKVAAEQENAPIPYTSETVTIGG